MLPIDKQPPGLWNETAELNDVHYQGIQNFLSQNCGIVLGENKQYLVKSRLSSLLGKFDFNSFADLANALQSSSPSHSRLKEAVIEAMTTNETSWFRDEKQFIALKEIVFPELFAKKSGSLKIWSAACSSGQEPYSISITLLDALQAANKNKSVQIIGTDISESILEEAKKAVYSELALSRGLDSATKARYFKKDYEGYTPNIEVTRQVRFQQFNLLKPFTALGRFDIIFCRNVLIYFSEQVKRDILIRMADILEPGGYLFLSSTEAMPAGLLEFQTIHNGQTCYYKTADMAQRGNIKSNQEANDPPDHLS